MTIKQYLQQYKFFIFQRLVFSFSCGILLVGSAVIMERNIIFGSIIMAISGLLTIFLIWDSYKLLNTLDGMIESFLNTTIRETELNCLSKYTKEENVLKDVINIVENTHKTN